MFKHVFLILLMTSILQQSFGAVIDLHVTHQEGVEHVEVNHEHGSDTVQETTEFSPNGCQITFDCHHCCHCHGGQVNIVLPNTTYLAFNYEKSFYTLKNRNLISAVVSTLLRPPQTHI